MGNKERLAEFNRSNILTAAKILFGEKGISQTTVDDIAKKADYSKSTVYVYFKSKEDIFNYIVLEHIQLLKDIIEKALEKSFDFPCGYYGICGALAEFYEKSPLYFESVLGEIKLPENEGESVLTQIYKIGEEINVIIENYLRSCISKGKVSINIEPVQATFTLWASISGIILLANKKEAYIREAMGVSKEEFMKNGFDLLMKSIKKEQM